MLSVTTVISDRKILLLYLSGQMQPGDVLLAVDGVSAKQKSLREVAFMILGPPGTTVTLRLLPVRDEFHDITELNKMPYSRVHLLSPVLSYIYLPGASAGFDVTNTRFMGQRYNPSCLFTMNPNPYIQTTLARWLTVLQTIYKFTSAIFLTLTI